MISLSIKGRHWITSSHLSRNHYTLLRVAKNSTISVSLLRVWSEKLQWRLWKIWSAVFRWHAQDIWIWINWAGVDGLFQPSYLLDCCFFFPRRFLQGDSVLPLIGIWNCGRGTQYAYGDYWMFSSCSRLYGWTWWSCPGILTPPICLLQLDLDLVCLWRWQVKNHDASFDVL